MTNNINNNNNSSCGLSTTTCAIVGVIALVAGGLGVYGFMKHGSDTSSIYHNDVSGAMIIPLLHTIQYETNKSKTNYLQYDLQYAVYRLLEAIISFFFSSLQITKYAISF